MKKLQDLSTQVKKLSSVESLVANYFFNVI